jgi:hypothetical protein
MELAQAAAAARAAKDAGLRHVVWSTLEDTRPHFERLGSDVPTVMDGYKVPHFDAKGEAIAMPPNTSPEPGTSTSCVTSTPRFSHSTPGSTSTRARSRSAETGRPTRRRRL